MHSKTKIFIMTRIIKKITLILIALWILMLVISYCVPIGLSSYQKKVIDLAQSSGGVDIQQMNDLRVSLRFPLTPIVLADNIKLTHSGIKSATIKQVGLTISPLGYLFNKRIVKDVRIFDAKITLSSLEQDKEGDDTSGDLNTEHIEFLTNNIHRVSLTNTLIQDNQNDYQFEEFVMKLSSGKVQLEGLILANQIPLDIDASVVFKQKKIALKIDRLMVNQSDISGKIQANLKILGLRICFHQFLNF